MKMLDAASKSGNFRNTKGNFFVYIRKNEEEKQVEDEEVLRAFEIVENVL